MKFNLAQLALQFARAVQTLRGVSPIPGGYTRKVSVANRRAAALVAGRRKYWAALLPGDKGAVYTRQRNRQDERKENKELRGLRKQHAMRSGYPGGGAVIR